MQHDFNNAAAMFLKICENKLLQLILEYLCMHAHLGMHFM